MTTRQFLLCVVSRIAYHWARQRPNTWICWRLHAKICGSKMYKISYGFHIDARWCIKAMRVQSLGLPADFRSTFGIVNTSIKYIIMSWAWSNAVHFPSWKFPPLVRRKRFSPKHCPPPYMLQQELNRHWFSVRSNKNRAKQMVENSLKK